MVSVQVVKFCVAPQQQEEVVQFLENEGVSCFVTAAFTQGQDAVIELFVDNSDLAAVATLLQAVQQRFN